VNTGLFGTKETFVPLAQADLSGDTLRFPYDKAKVKDAPKIDTDGHLSPQEEQELYRYYGMGTGTAMTTETTTGMTTGMAAGTTTGRATDTTSDFDARGTVGHDTSGPTTDNAMTRSEERVRAGTEKVEAGRARLRKYVVTDQQQVNVPVTREQVRVEREPITDENRGQAMDGPALSDEEHEIVLTEERPVVQTEAVPVERVRLSKDQIQDEQTVTADVRKEVIDTEGGGTTTAGRTSGYTEDDDNDPSLGDKARGLADRAKDKLS